jgi:hypothetical protein
MKKLIQLIVLLNLIDCANAQSKAETTEWIISKFKKWKVVDSRIGYSELGTITGGTSEVPISLSFVNCNMTFKSNYSYIMSSSSYDEITYSFNFGDVDKLEWVRAYDNDLLIISTNGRLVKQVFVPKSKYSFEKSKSDETTIKYIDRCIIAFDSKGEDDFKSRMIKALNHLQSFCPPTKSVKEIF